MALSAEKIHPLTSLHPVRKRKIHEHPEGLGEVHLFPDITKWDTGRCCCSLSFGKESKCRLVSGEQMHSGVQKAKTPWLHRGKGEASPWTQKRTPETPWKHPSIVLQTCITRSKWVNSFKKTYRYSHVKWIVWPYTVKSNLILYTQKVVSFTACPVAYIIILLW